MLIFTSFRFRPIMAMYKEEGTASHADRKELSKGLSRYSLPIYYFDCC